MPHDLGDLGHHLQSSGNEGAKISLRDTVATSCRPRQRNAVEWLEGGPGGVHFARTHAPRSMTVARAPVDRIFDKTTKPGDRLARQVQIRSDTLRDEGGKPNQRLRSRRKVFREKTYGFQRLTAVEPAGGACPKDTATLQISGPGRFRVTSFGGNSADKEAISCAVNSFSPLALLRTLARAAPPRRRTNRQKRRVQRLPRSVSLRCHR